LLLAVVLTLGRLYHDSEMAALQACGFGPARLLVPLFCFAGAITVGLAWLVFVQVPQADREAQLLRQSAMKAAQFGQLDAGRFRSFSGGDAVFYAERVDPEGVLHNVFVQRETAGRFEVALADTATYSKAAPNGAHLVTLFNGRRYEGVPGRDDFRVIEFREHGIPIATPANAVGSKDPDTKPTRELLGSDAPSDIAQLQFRASTPLMALVLTLLALPLSRLRPRQGRYARVGVAIVVYFVYSILLSATKVWVEKGDLPPAVGVWWVHAAALTLGLYLVARDARTA
jgi:lipopolysaccharide export system permease protein